MNVKAFAKIHSCICDLHFKDGLITDSERFCILKYVAKHHLDSD